MAVVVGLLLATVAEGPTAAASAVTVDVVTAPADGHAPVTQTQQAAVPGPGAGPLVDVRVDQPRQRLQGVGAALTESSASLIAGLPAPARDALLHQLFDPTRDGLSVVRVPIGASDFALALTTEDDSPTPDPDLSGFSIDRDRRWIIPVLREILAIDPTVEVVASPWTAPAWMKTSGSLVGGSLRPEYEDAYARYLVRFLQAYRDEGIGIGWLTVQNEPAADPGNTPSMVMGADQQTRLVHDRLGPRLLAAGLGTHVLTWDHNWCTATPPGGCTGPAPPAFALQVLQRTGGAYPLAGTGLHCYGGDQIAADDGLHDAWPDLQIWETECSGGTWQGSRADAFGQSASRILTDWAHWANASLLWNLALDPDHGPHTGGCGTCRGVVTVDPTTGSWTEEADADVMAAVSRFGPPGSGGLTTTVTAGSGLTAAGVCSPDERPAALVWNPGSATPVTVRFGSLDLAVTVPADSLVAVRAPQGTSCRLASAPDLPAPPSTTTTTTAPTIASTTTASTTTASSAPGTGVPGPTSTPKPAPPAPGTFAGTPSSTVPGAGAGPPGDRGPAPAVSPPAAPVDGMPTFTG